MTTRLQLFDVYIAVDWSARNGPSPTVPSPDALWVGEKLVLGASAAPTAEMAGTQRETYWRTRQQCVAYLQQTLLNHARHSRRVLIGYDLNFGFPAGLVESLELAGPAPKWRRIWNLLTAEIVDDATNANNRFAVAAALNARCMAAMPDGMMDEIGPFWGCPRTAQGATLRSRSAVFPYLTRTGHSLRRLRWTEMRAAGTQPAWRLYGTASVGGQTLVGIPAVARLRYDPHLLAYSRIWPFEIDDVNALLEAAAAPLVVHVEIWPGLLAASRDVTLPIKDQAQVRATVDWLTACDGSGTLAQLLTVPLTLPLAMQHACIEEEGWILGVRSSSATGESVI